MRFAYLCRNYAVIMLLALAALAARAQINPNTQIAWPAPSCEGSSIPNGVWIPSLGQCASISSISCNPATTSTLGCMKADGVTILIGPDGTISAAPPPPSTSVNGLTGAVVIQAPTDTHITVTKSGQNINLATHNVAYTDTANTFATGVQTTITGNTNNVGRIVQGAGNIVPSAIRAQTVSNSGQNVGTVSVGQYELVWSVYRFGCPSAPSSGLGNTWSNIYQNNANGCFILWGAPITHSGTETTGVGGITSLWMLVSNVNLVTPLDVANAATWVPFPGGGATDTNSFSLTTTQPGDLLITAAAAIDIGGTCTWNGPSSPWTTFLNVPSGSQPAFASASVATTTGSQSVTWTDVCTSGGGGNGQLRGMIALKTSSTFIQGADLDQWQNASGAILAHVSGDGAYNPPQSAGIPQVHDPGTIEYDTTNHCTRAYDAVLGWQCLQYAGGTPRTSGTNGFYAIAIDGTITEWISTPALNNNTPTTVSLPHAIPTAIMSIVCTDNGGRVQSGNDQAVGANTVGLSAPFSTFFVNTPSTGMTAYCIVVGY
jgi:hypothetical protein